MDTITGFLKKALESLSPRKKRGGVSDAAGGMTGDRVGESITSHQGVVNATVEMADAVNATSAKMAMSLSLGSMELDDGVTRGVPKHRNVEAYEALDAMVEVMGGDRPVHSVLVANNGLAAVKFMRSVRNWAFKRFGDERVVNLIAMATPEDMLADAEHIRLADQFIEVPGGRNVNNYANVQLIVSLAVRAGVDAVWPGWYVFDRCGGRVTE